MNKQQADDTVARLLRTVPTNYDDAIDVAEWISRRISACYEFDFINGYSSFIKGYKLDDLNAHVREFFKSDPSVISIMKPLRRQIQAGHGANDFA
jgi:hypothetical protein